MPPAGHSAQFLSEGSCSLLQTHLISGINNLSTEQMLQPFAHTQLDILCSIQGDVAVAFPFVLGALTAR